MQRLIQVGHSLVGTIDGERVLDQIVGADCEEIDLAGQQVRRERRRRHFDHDADLHRRRRAAAIELQGDVAKQAPGCAHLFDAGDEWQQHAQIAVGGRAQHRPELLLERRATGQAQAQAAQTEGVAAFGGPALDLGRGEPPE